MVMFSTVTSAPSGQSRGISPRRSAPQAAGSFTNRPSASTSCPACQLVTAHAATPPGSSTATTGPIAVPLLLTGPRSRPADARVRKTAPFHPEDPADLLQRGG